jgi:MFS family permease
MRWVVAAAGTGLMAVLGTVYSWSLYAQPLAAAFGWSATTTTWAFASAIFFLGVGAVVGGRLQDRLGPRPVALAGAALWATGNLAAGLGTAALGAPWLYLSYGLVGGLGLGLAYVTPVAAVTKWFPERRGLGSGLVVAGFGLGAFGYNLALRATPAFAAAAREAAAVLAARQAGQVAVLGAESVEAVRWCFAVSGLVFGVVGMGCAAVLRDPPEVTAGATGPTAGATSTSTPTSTPTAVDWSPALALRAPQFWALWAMLFLNVTAGILFISCAVPLLSELTGASAETAVAVYGLIALANGLGRFLWGAISDRLGRRLAYGLIYGVQVGVFAAVGSVHSLPLAAGLFALVLLCYGGGFGTMPSLVADWFGTRHLGINYGWILSAWGAAGVVGPIFVAAVKDGSGRYAGALPVMAGVLALATLLPAVTRRPVDRGLS